MTAATARKDTRVPGFAAQAEIGGRALDPWAATRESVWSRHKRAALARFRRRGKPAEMTNRTGNRKTKKDRAKPAPCRVGLDMNQATASTPPSAWARAKAAAQHRAKSSEVTPPNSVASSAHPWWSRMAFKSTRFKIPFMGIRPSILGHRTLEQIAGERLRSKV